MPRCLPRLFVLFATFCSSAQAHDQLRPYVYRVAAHQVVDGDTVRTTLDLGFHLSITLSARLDGVDAPEMNTAAGQAVAHFVKQWCARQQTLLAVSVAKDKFEGRYIAELHGDRGRLADELLSHRLARLYDGGRRREWTEAELERIEQSAAAAIAELEAVSSKP